MNEQRLKRLLYNALVKFAYDEYEKGNVLDGLGMTEEEFNYITDGEEIEFREYN
ncbi:MAG: hypothetical protein IJX81_01350 [Clostridia bacterium]|nr:hypothetical protein [Clostridia bacterium]